MTVRYGPSQVAEHNLYQAKGLWDLANALVSAAPSWGATSRAGHAHVIAAAALYGLAQAIGEVEGRPLTSIRSARTCGVENALLENLTELARIRGPREAAELAYRLGDGVATGVGS